jgi:hypothetical protein
MLVFFFLFLDLATNCPQWPCLGRDMHFVCDPCTFALGMKGSQTFPLLGGGAHFFLKFLKMEWWLCSCMSAVMPPYPRATCWLHGTCY